MSRTLVIGLGNPLMGDDGFGLEVLARLRDGWQLDGVELADGGTWGMSLLPMIEEAGRVVLIDAIAAGGKPGEIVLLERERLPIYLTRKLSPHQIDLRDVLAAAELRGTLPQQIIALGVEPGAVELSTELTKEVEAQVDVVLALVLDRLDQWGHSAIRIAELEELCTR